MSAAEGGGEIAAGAPLDDPRIRVVIRNVTFVGIFAHAGFIALFWKLGVPWMALFNVGSVASWILARWLGARGRTRAAVQLLLVEVIAHAVAATLALGWGSGFEYYLIPVIPFLLFNGQFSRRTLIAGAAGVIALFVLLRSATFGMVPGWIDPGTLRLLEGANILIPLATLSLVSYYFRAASMEIERRMESLAMTDALTRLPNRRRMREMLKAAQAAARRSGKGYAVLVGDIDDFKRINDERGHDAGDEALRAIADVLRGALRGQDAVARWGGEEFLFLLPETDLAGAAVLAEKLRRAVEAAAPAFNGEPMRLTMTFGAAAGEPGGSGDEAMRRADRALYEGKRLGKNRVTPG